MSDRLLNLLDGRIAPGRHELVFYSRLAVEVEEGELDRKTARFWARHDRCNLVRPGYDIVDHLETWDDSTHGSRPDVGSSEWEGVRYLVGESVIEYRDPYLMIPKKGFFADPIASSEDDDWEADVWCLDLEAISDYLQLEVVSDENASPKSRAATWQCTRTWIGNSGIYEFVVREPMSLRTLLQLNAVSARVSRKDNSLWVSAIAINCEEVMLGSCKCKSSEFKVHAPDNMRAWRAVAAVVGRLMCLYRRSSDRVYAPGGPGFDESRREFASLAELGARMCETYVWQA
eukprot:TRINITY_DN32522_c0_g1_i1.p1 TRINITY_DN32522_c0_g1~~TRINITY_DN32522_c0_g1_i1.p1  ORF type:complete len:288 (-),score=32.32 TRINITY_DN32522_c0_g1_i1:318-1181(-)